MKSSKLSILRLHLVLLIVFGFCSILHAKPISIEKAKKVAVNQLFDAPLALKEKALSEADDYVSRVYTITEDSRDVYYVLNMIPEGWIIISADDIAYPIIAYSPTGHYEEDGHPPAFDEWMENVKKEINSAIENQLIQLPRSAAAWERLENPVESLGIAVVDELIQTSWGQGGTGVDFYLIFLPSYDAYCPFEKNFLNWSRVAPTGCVATAMGQIMKYWSWPRFGTTGDGQHSYDPYWDCESGFGVTCYGYGERSRNFSEITYNWDIMPNTVPGRAAGTHNPGEQAVQELLADIGVAVEMNYHPAGSGALLWGSPWCFTDPYYRCFNTDAVYAFETFFRYDSSANYSHRGSNDAAWINKLKGELDHGRPILYRGEAAPPATSGHAFICDGYDTDDLFHFNWGWDGSYDGWFNVDDLTPGSHDYTYDQGGIFDLKPDAKPIISDIIYNSCISQDCTTPVFAMAIDPAFGILSYEWTALDGGTIIGSGQMIQFHPPTTSLPPACLPYRVKVVVTSNVYSMSTEETVEIFVKQAGDVNGDGVVNIIDKVQVRNHFGESGNPGWIDADVNCDGVVNIIDKVKVRNQFGQSGCVCP
jgi:hypothetical protein